MGNNTIKLKSTLVLIGGATGFRPDIERGAFTIKDSQGNLVATPPENIDNEVLGAHFVTVNPN